MLKTRKNTSMKVFLPFLFVSLVVTAQPLKSQTTVFINEIHYDNTGTDAGEAIEVAGPAGTDLTGWSIVLYNGSGGAAYNTTSLSGTIPDLCGGFGVVVVNYGVNGIQNGSPDGIALVDNSSNVVQFLSYEGTFTAVGGAADGMMSVDIGVQEGSSTPVGYSLRLTGAGTVYEDFAWSTEAPSSFGSCNPGQTFGGDAAPAVLSVNPLSGAIGVPVDANIEINFSESVNVTGTWFTITGSSSGNHTAAVSGGPTGFTLNPNNDFQFGETITVTVVAANVTDVDLVDPPDNMNADYSFSFTAVYPSTGWVINEILADPASDITGDANGDGVRDASDDEFVEIVNNTGGTVDISGWTLSDGVGVRHVFELGTVVADQGAVVVFGGGTPTGTFGDAFVQTASTGALGLNNGGDQVSLNDGTNIVAYYSYGSEGGNDQSLTRDPDISGPEPLVLHTTAAGADGRLFSPGTEVDGTKFPGSVIPVLVKEIFEIQGSGLSSPFSNRIVTTNDNVVTAVGPDGFFIQTPTERSDNDINTSDGVFVYTGSAPTVSVGDLVHVKGKVVEYYGFTEFTNEAITVTGTGVLPSPVVFDETVPSPNQPQSPTEFEKYEGMLVSITGGTVTESNQRFSSDPTAEVYITAASHRVFREKGALYPGLGMPTIPVWDGNPEVFELDPDRLGLPNRTIPAGSSFNATGVLGYEFGGYEFWPTSLTISEATLPRPVRVKTPDEFTVGSLNLYRLFDTVDDGDGTVVSADEYARRLAKFSLYIRTVLNSPDILAVEEAEKIGVLNDLANKIHSDNPSISYTAYLVEGNDIGGIDIGFLVRSSRVQVGSVTQLGKDETYIDPVSGNPAILHDRPPLLLNGSFLANGVPTFPITVLAVHNRSFSGIEDPVDGVRIRQKRLEQAQSIAQKVQDIQTANPDVHLVVTGDFNAYQFTDGYVDPVGQISGNFDPSENLLSGPDLVDPDLTNQVLGLPANEQYSYSYQGSAQVLDHALTSSALNKAVTGFAYGRGDADAAVDWLYDDTTPLRSSDHDGLVLFIDATPPQISVSDPASLWPPDHKYQSFSVSGFVSSVSDNGALLPVESVYITKVTSDEEEDAVGGGDGSTTDDIVIENYNTVKIRAEREGSGNGRVYSIYVAAQDQSGNIGTAVFRIGVPKSVKDMAVEDKPVYEVVSNLLPPASNAKMLADKKAGESVSASEIPAEFSLEQNYPNPFNPTTRIRYSIPQEEHVVLRVFDILGRELILLVSEVKVPGVYETELNMSNYPSGIYIYSMTAGSYSQVRKLVLLK